MLYKKALQFEANENIINITDLNFFKKYWYLNF